MTHKTIQMPSSFSVDEAAQFREETSELLQGEPITFELDFMQCKFVDSTGLGVIVSLYKKCKDSGGSVIIKHLNADVARVFKMARLDRVLTIQ